MIFLRKRKNRSSLFLQEVTGVAGAINYKPMYWAKKNVILLEVDFPRMKQLSPELQAQNNSLQQSFGVMGYPTCWMFNMIKNDSTKKFGIDPIGSLGYPAGSLPGSEHTKFLNVADSLMKNYKNKKKS